MRFTRTNYFPLQNAISLFFELVFFDTSCPCMNYIYSHIGSNSISAFIIIIATINLISYSDTCYRALALATVYISTSTFQYIHSYAWWWDSNGQHFYCNFFCKNSFLKVHIFPHYSCRDDKPSI